MTHPSLDLVIPADHPAFAGHFPGMPIVPGVVLLDAAMNAIATATGLNLGACRLDAAKFLNPAGPGTALRVEYECREDGAIRFDILSADSRIATASLRSCIKPAAEG
ncbi:MAG: acyl-coenzyme synthetase/AMP-(fatty) acid ligase-like protein [Paucimonas sp.]|nr:acyl-coenzyme synthetase/AMP-(fatty) acid ligase-like protein [Paucimonas sp.]